MTIKRKYMPGNEWLYFKIYSGPKFLDDLLINQIYVITNNLKGAGIIDKFFFIRYSDSDGNHLRLRYHFKDMILIPRIMKEVSDNLNVFIENKIIWKIVIDTYNRELERYGENLIETVETIFEISSFTVLEDLKKCNDSGNSEERWLNGILFIENILDILKYSFNDRKLLYNTMYENYSKEFNPQKLTKEFLKNKFRENAQKIEEKLFNRSIENENNILISIEPYIITIQEFYKKSIGTITFDALLQSLFHMHFNRLFHSKSRLNEFVLYYLMGALYSSILGREKFKAIN